MVTMIQRKIQVDKIRTEVKEEIDKIKYDKENLLFFINDQKRIINVAIKKHVSPERVKELEDHLENLKKRKEYVDKIDTNEFYKIRLNKELRAQAIKNVMEIKLPEPPMEKWMEILFTNEEYESVKHRTKVNNDIIDKLDMMYRIIENIKCSEECAAKMARAHFEYNVPEKFLTYLHLNISPIEWKEAFKTFCKLGEYAVWATPEDWTIFGKGLVEEVEKRKQHPSEETRMFLEKYHISKTSAFAIIRFLTEKNINIPKNKEDTNKIIKKYGQQIINSKFIFTNKKAFSRMMNTAFKKIFRGPNLKISTSVKNEIKDYIDPERVEKILNCFMNGYPKTKNNPIHITDIKDAVKLPKGSVEKVLNFLNHIGIVRQFYSKDGVANRYFLILDRNAIDKEWHNLYDEIERFIKVTNEN